MLLLAVLYSLGVGIKSHASTLYVSTSDLALFSTIFPLLALACASFQPFSLALSSLSLTHSASMPFRLFGCSSYSFPLFICSLQIFFHSHLLAMPVESSEKISHFGIVEIGFFGEARRNINVQLKKRIKINWTVRYFAYTPRYVTIIQLQQNEKYSAFCAMHGWLGDGWTKAV